jgi:hypothetical protein
MRAAFAANWGHISTIDISQKSGAINPIANDRLHHEGEDFIGNYRRQMPPNRLGQNPHLEPQMSIVEM